MVFMIEILGCPNVPATERTDEMIPMFSKWLFCKSVEDLCLYVGQLNIGLVWFCSLGPPELTNVKSIPIETAVRVMTVHGI